MLDALTIETFAPLTGSSFTLVLEGGNETDLELLEVSNLTHGENQVSEGQRAPFALLFRGPRELELQQQIVRLRHESLGELDLFLVPMHPDREATLFEAVFN